MTLIRALALSLLLVSAAASARSAGIATPVCYGCHSGGAVPNVTLTANPATISPGGTTTITVSIQAVNGNAGGLYLRSNGVGTFSLISGQSTKLVNGEVVHSSTRTGSGGFVTFQVNWTAPSTPGGVDITASGLSANGNGGSSGDNYAQNMISLVYGCAGNTYYRDMDGDGVGSSTSGTTKNCSVPQGFSSKDGDCNDNDQTVFPNRTELCNGKDDNCNSQVDEGLANVTMYPDADHDGYGRQGTTINGCSTTNGYAPNSNDCDDTDATVHPGGNEVCNLKDDNCDGSVDEGARVICGVGMCRRYGPTCDIATCTPGSPSKEICNALDDDCDGLDDNGADLCSDGLTCSAGVCGGTPVNPGNDAGSTGGGSGGSAGGGAGGGTQTPPSTGGGCSTTALAPMVVAAVLSAAGMIRRRRRG